MKKILTISLALILSCSITSIQAQDEMQYLFGGKDNDVSISGFGGMMMEFSSFDKDFGFSMGGGAAMLINQKFYVGAYGMGLTTQHPRSFTIYDDDLERNFNEDLYARFGHGGFWLGYVHNPKKSIHWGVNTTLGWGTVSLTDKTEKDYSNRWIAESYDNVFVITPQADLEMNLLKWMRVNVGVGYRIVTGVNKDYQQMTDNGLVEIAYFDSNALNSVTGNITLAFGWFGN